MASTRYRVPYGINITQSLLKEEDLSRSRFSRRTTFFAEGFLISEDLVKISYGQRYSTAEDLSKVCYAKKSSKKASVERRSLERLLFIK